MENQKNNLINKVQDQDSKDDFNYFNNQQNEEQKQDIDQKFKQQVEQIFKEDLQIDQKCQNQDDNFKNKDNQLINQQQRIQKQSQKQYIKKQQQQVDQVNDILQKQKFIKEVSEGQQVISRIKIQKKNKLKQSNPSLKSMPSGNKIYRQNTQKEIQMINNLKRQTKNSQQAQQCFIKIDQIQKSEDSSLTQRIQFTNGKMMKKKKKNIQSKKQFKQPQKQCRICLQNQSQGRLIRPCICSGSINHVHQKCIRQWILKKTDLKGRKKVRCQVCDFQYKYKIQKHRQLSCQEYTRSYQQNTGTFRCFYLIMLILFLGLFSMIAVIILSTTQTTTGQNIRNGLIGTDSSRVIFSCVCFLFFNILMFAIILFIVEYGVKLQITIQDVLDIADIVPKKKNGKLYPKIVVKKVQKQEQFQESRNGLFD